MSDVKRYAEYDKGLMACDDGDFVSFDDYTAAVQRAEQAEFVLDTWQKEAAMQEQRAEYANAKLARVREWCEGERARCAVGVVVGVAVVMPDTIDAWEADARRLAKLATHYERCAARVSGRHDCNCGYDSALAQHAILAAEPHQDQVESS